MRSTAISAMVVALVLSFLSAIVRNGGGSAVLAATSKAKSAQASSTISVPARAPYQWPSSVALSPSGKWLAVAAADRRVYVRDVSSGRWIRTFRNVHAPRWHPSKPVLIVAGGDAEKPAFYAADVATGSLRQLFRSDPNPFAWTRSGVLINNGIVVIVDGVKSASSGNFGHRIPWDYGMKASVQYLSSGSKEQVAAEVLSLDGPMRGPTRWVETYRKLPGRRQWLRSGRIEARLSGKAIVWYPRNPNWLADGRLVYLRVYPAQWTHSRQASNGRMAPGYLSARNRAELWVCAADGSRQRKITTLWDLRPYDETPTLDWIAVDPGGNRVFYVSGHAIGYLRLAVPKR